METEVLRKEGYLVEAAICGEEALRKARHIPFDLVLAELTLPPMTVLRLIKQFKEIDHSLPILVCCAEAQTGEALEAIWHGAYDYIVKPFQIPNLLIKVHNALEQNRLHDLVELLDEKVRGRHRFGDLLGGSVGMQLVYQSIDRLASTEANLLITGEPGVGKNLVAKEIHGISRRRDKPLYVVSGEGLSMQPTEATPGDHPEETALKEVESLTQLFGAEAGSTVILQEVAHLSPGIQRLLCGLFRRAELGQQGSSTERSNDVRIISTTAADLDQTMEEGRLLPELYYRLGGFQIRVPPLRERREDLQLLAQHFFEIACSEAGRHLCCLSPRGLEMLTGHDWPGNVRELESLVRRLAASSIHRVIGPRDIESSGCTLLMNPSVQPLEEFERAYVERVLVLVAGNMGKAAKLLGIPRSSFYRKFRKD